MLKEGEGQEMTKDNFFHGMRREKEINMMSDVRMIWSHSIVMWKIIMTLPRAVLLYVQSTPPPNPYPH